ncbi:MULTISPECIES: hypothetical protein [Emticicia]|uniref:hypothetical protein n=1 Tax=Emticicia TaxID=312278 RepID=UPI0007D898DF|nr:MULTISPECIES: hypothetical protein [Emticicia]
MNDYEALFQEITADIPEAKASKMFGVPCIKAPNGKAVAGFHVKYLTVKLDKETEQETLAIDGVEVFNPSGKRPMNGWLQVPIHYADQWSYLAKKAFEYVKTL